MRPRFALARLTRFGTFERVSTREPTRPCAFARVLVRLVRVCSVARVPTLLLAIELFTFERFTLERLVRVLARRVARLTVLLCGVVERLTALLTREAFAFTFAIGACGAVLRVSLFLCVPVLLFTVLFVLLLVLLFVLLFAVLFCATGFVGLVCVTAGAELLRVSRFAGIPRSVWFILYVALFSIGLALLRTCPRWKVIPALLCGRANVLERFSVRVRRPVRFIPRVVRPKILRDVPLCPV